jgi:hypothetical protein
MPVFSGMTMEQPTRGILRRGPWLFLALTVAACTPEYPLDRPGSWSIEQYGGSANDANLRAMVANPRDLIAGTGETNSLGAEASPPVTRLHSRQRTPLINLDTLDVNLVQAPQQPQPAQGGGNAGQ